MVAEATGGNMDIIERQKNKNPLTRFILEKVGAEYLDRKTMYCFIENQISSFALPSVILIDGVRAIADEQFIHNTLNGLVVMVSRDLWDSEIRP